MKQELIKHLNNIERLVQKNYITLEIKKTFMKIVMVVLKTLKKRL